LITDEIYLSHEPTFDFTDRWYPDQPFSYSVFESDNLDDDGPLNQDRRFSQLLLTPTQFKGNTSGGELRQFSTITLRLKYLSDGADDDLLDDTFDPIVRDTQRTSDGKIRAIVIERDNDGPGDELDAEMVVKTNTGAWQTVSMNTFQIGTTERWQIEGSLPANTFLPLQLLIQAEDEAGNVGVETYGGRFDIDYEMYLPNVNVNR